MSNGADNKETGKLYRSHVRFEISDMLGKWHKFYHIYHGNYDIGYYMWNQEKGVYELDKEALTDMIITFRDILFKDLDPKEMPIITGKDVEEIIKMVRKDFMEIKGKEPLRVSFINGTIEWVERDGQYHADKVVWIPADKRDPDFYSFYYVPWKLNAEVVLRLQDGEIRVEDLEALANKLCPNALKTFKEWVGDKWVTLFQIIGYTLYPTIVMGQGFRLVGGHNSGKTTFRKLVDKILGNNVVHITSADLLYTRFGESELYHKLANTVEEDYLYTNAVMYHVKHTIEGTFITVDRRWKDHMTFCPIAKFIVESPRMPVVVDFKENYALRVWIKVEFINKFDRDPQFMEKVFTPEEINGVVTVSILAVIRALRNNMFDNDTTRVYWDNLIKGKNTNKKGK